MNIDLISDSAWTAVIEGRRDIPFEFLALQVLLNTLRHQLRAREISILDGIRELKNFYRKFNRLPVAEKDFRKIAEQEAFLTSWLLDPKEIARRIKAGQSLMLAGEEGLLSALPPGNWIGGTIPYFMAQDGGCLCSDKIFVTEIPAEFQASVHQYACPELPRLYEGVDEGTVTFVILPADSPAHTEFALRAPRYASFAQHPLVGWVAGMDLAMLGKATPKVFCGGPQPLNDGAAVMRMRLPSDRMAQIKIINLFEPGQGDTISFSSSGFSATQAEINGQERNFAEYLQGIKADVRLPLVADYCGAMINVSFKSLDPRNGFVEFYAPIVAGIQYKLASPVNDYISEFEASLKKASPESVLFSCNCILNYLYSKLEGRRTGIFVGPVTFGEIAYQLLNQTLVYIEVVKVAPPSTSSTAATLELAAAHEELRTSELRFRALCDSAPLGIFLTDALGRVLYDNPRCRHLSGLSTKSATADAWMQRIHPRDLAAVTAAIEDCAREGRDFDHEFRFIGSDGKICWVQSRTTVLRSETGEITGRIGTMEDISVRKQAEIELERINRDLMRASREAGIAEVASGVLHNVKNVINSVNVSASLIAERLRQSESVNLAKVNALLREHADHLGSFLTKDPKGKIVPRFLEQLAEHIAVEREAILGELQQLEKGVQHIKELVAAEQSYAKQSGATEIVKPVDLMEDSLRIVSAGLLRHGIQLVRQYDAKVPDIIVEKHKVLQILVNFMRNAKEACQASGRTERKVTLQTAYDGKFVVLGVTDDGVGISPENLSRLCEHGFTTKKDGHGFGLHSSVRAAEELGGDIKMHSEGVGAGAIFSLRLPLRRTSDDNNRG